MTARSSQAAVRNPVLALPAAARLAALPPPARAALAAVLRDIAADARIRAEHCWRRHKAPMALYWKCVAVYAGHIARAADRAVDLAASSVPAPAPAIAKPANQATREPALEDA